MNSLAARRIEFVGGLFLAPSTLKVTKPTFFFELRCFRSQNQQITLHISEPAKKYKLFLLFLLQFFLLLFPFELILPHEFQETLEQLVRLLLGRSPLPPVIQNYGALLSQSGSKNPF